MTDVAVIVLDLDGGPWLEECLQSIAQQSVPPRRVILFDNGSRVPTSQRVPLRAGLEMVRSEANLGFTGGVNGAFSLVEQEFVALVNSDVVLDRDWLETVAGAMQDARVAAAQTVLLRGDGQFIDGAGIEVSDGTIRQVGHGALPGAPLPEAWGVSATAALYRRAALGERVFDPRFFAYYEDVELCARLHESGWRTVVVPAVRGTHRGSASAARLGSRAKYLRTRNRYFVSRLHRSVGRIGALFREDLRLLLRGRGSIRGMIAGLCSPLS
ncbi:MAG: glycosyltransferase family 2 protein [Acidobacteriota bacterium]